MKAESEEAERMENRVKERAETSPDASLHVVRIHYACKPKGKTPPYTHTHTTKKETHADYNFNSMAACQQI